MRIAPWPVAPWWLVAACALTGLCIGWLLRRELEPRAFRLDDEVPLPRRSLAWLPWAHALIWSVLAGRLGPAYAAAYLPVALLVATGGCALAAIDMDVHRLPLGLTRPLGLLVAAGLTLTAAVSGDWAAWRRALVCGALAWGLLLLVAVAAALSGSAFGMGDVTLAGIVGLVTGQAAWWAPLVALYAAFVLAGGYALLRLLTRRSGRRDAIAFGPWLLLGGLVALLVQVDLLRL